MTKRARIVVNEAEMMDNQSYSERPLNIAPELPQIDEMVQQEEEDFEYDEAKCINCRIRKEEGK